MKNNILIVNHNIENCGVYQYGKRVSDICAKSKDFNFYYLKFESLEKFFEEIEKKTPSIIIYNYLPSTMPWFDRLVFERIRGMKIKQGTIIHNTPITGFDFYLHQDPYYPTSVDNYGLPRPLFEYKPEKKNEKNDVLQIGTFGFVGNHKFIPEICRAVSEEFIETPVQINLHITQGFYSNGDFAPIKEECVNSIQNSNIRLNFTHDFLTDEKMLDFLYGNDLNVFFYENYPFYNGISSVIDYGLSVKKPIAICKSNMFSHIIDVQPSICVEDTDLIDIINNGFDPLLEKYKTWSHKNFISNIENIVSRYA